MSCVSEFNEPGTIQATLDLTALRDALQTFSTPQSESFFNEAMDAIPKLSSKNLQFVKQLLKTIRSRMALQLTCFASPT
ncbi:exocyst complex component 2-like [Ctenocephalides felis]|nr:exocyst complex component 2-like [Ctenocephalides felis]